MATTKFHSSITSIQISNHIVHIYAARQFEMHSDVVCYSFQAGGTSKYIKKNIFFQNHTRSSNFPFEFSLQWFSLHPFPPNLFHVLKMVRKIKKKKKMAKWNHRSVNFVTDIHRIELLLSFPKATPTTLAHFVDIKEMVPSYTKCTLIDTKMRNSWKTENRIRCNPPQKWGSISLAVQKESSMCDAETFRNTHSNHTRPISRRHSPMCQPNSQVPEQKHPSLSQPEIQFGLPKNTQEYQNWHVPKLALSFLLSHRI